MHRAAYLSLGVCRWRAVVGPQKSAALCRQCRRQAAAKAFSLQELSSCPVRSHRVRPVRISLRSRPRPSPERPPSPLLRSDPHRLILTRCGRFGRTCFLPRKLRLSRMKNSRRKPYAASSFCPGRFRDDPPEDAGMWSRLVRDLPSLILRVPRIRHPSSKPLVFSERSRYLHGMHDVAYSRSR